MNVDLFIKIITRITLLDKKNTVVKKIRRNIEFGSFQVVKKLQIEDSKL